VSSVSAVVLPFKFEKENHLIKSQLLGVDVIKGFGVGCWHWGGGDSSLSRYRFAKRPQEWPALGREGQLERRLCWRWSSLAGGTGDGRWGDCERMEGGWISTETQRTQRTAGERDAPEIDSRLFGAGLLPRIPFGREVGVHPPLAAPKATRVYPEFFSGAFRALFGARPRRKGYCISRIR
jgi:hypothetical protein